MNRGRIVDTTKLVQRNVSFVMFIIGTITAVTNFIYLSQEPNSSFTRYFVYCVLIFIFAALALGGNCLSNRLTRVIHIAEFLILAILAIRDDYSSAYGLLLFIIAVLLALRYGFYRRHFHAKLSASLLFYICLVIFFSGKVSVSNLLYYGMNALVLSFILLYLLYSIYSIHIRAYTFHQVIDDMTINDLEGERKELINKITVLNDEISQYLDEKNEIDLSKTGLTPGEMKVLSSYMKQKGTDVELAVRLHLSPHTIRNHFRKIRDKLGVDSKHEIYELCRFVDWKLHNSTEN